MHKMVAIGFLVEISTPYLGTYLVPSMPSHCNEYSVSERGRDLNGSLNGISSQDLWYLLLYKLKTQI